MNFTILKQQHLTVDQMLMQAQQALEIANAQIDEIHASTSWRVTKPLREIKKYLIKFKDKFSFNKNHTSSAVKSVGEKDSELQPNHGAAFNSEKLNAWHKSYILRLEKLRQGTLAVAYFAENEQSHTHRYRAENMVEVLNSEDDAKVERIKTSAACFYSSDLAKLKEIAERADVLVISRVRYEAGVEALVCAFKALEKSVLFDIDDWVFDVDAIDLIIKTIGESETDEALNYWYSVVGRMAKTMHVCDGAITTNAYLAEKIRGFLKGAARERVSLVSNFMSQTQWDVSNKEYSRKLNNNERQNAFIKLGYFSGSATHNLDFALIVPALSNVMKINKKIQLVLVGQLNIHQALGVEFIANYGERIIEINMVDYLELPKIIADIDFNLVPLQQNEFTNCKSELKFFDAAAVGTVTIASPAYAYKNAIRHKVNGYLSADNEWEKTITEAIETKESDAALYKSIVEVAYNNVKESYIWKTQKAAILQAIA